MRVGMVKRGIVSEDDCDDDGDDDHDDGDDVIVVGVVVRRMSHDGVLKSHSVVLVSQSRLV